MVKIKDATDEELRGIAHGWNKTQIPPITNIGMSMNYIVEGTQQGGVFLSWVSSYYELMTRTDIPDIPLDKRHDFAVLMTETAKEKCPNFINIITRFESWVNSKSINS